MSTFIPGDDPYRKFLQEQAHLDDIKYELNSQTSRLIANQDQVSAGLLEGISDLAESVSAEVTELRSDIAGLEATMHADLQELNATFRWGFSEVLLGLGRLGDTLNDLKSLMENRNKIWAYEQYFEARRAFLNGWHRESFDLVQQAIDGYGSNPGYKLEFRFHFLLGQNYLGNRQNHETDIINPEKAEAAFLNAAKYSEHESKSDAAVAYLCASRSAYIQEKIEAALAHAETATQLDPGLGEAVFQKTKLLCRTGDWEDAAPIFSALFTSEPTYAVKAASDPDIRSFVTELNTTIKAATQTLKEKATEKQTIIADEIAQAEKLAGTLEQLDFAPLTELQEAAATADKHYESETLVGMRAALDEYTTALKTYYTHLQTYLDKLTQQVEPTAKTQAETTTKQLEAELNQATIENSNVRLERSERIVKLWMGIGAGIPILVFGLLVSGTLIFDPEAITSPEIGVLAFGFTIMAVVGAGIGWIVGNVIAGTRMLFPSQSATKRSQKAQELKTHQQRSEKELAALEADRKRIDQFVANLDPAKRLSQHVSGHTCLRFQFQEPAASLTSSLLIGASDTADTHTLLEEGQALPAKVDRRYGSPDGKPYDLTAVLYRTGEAATTNEHIGTVTIPKVAPKSPGEANLYMTFTVKTDGVLTVTAEQLE